MLRALTLTNPPTRASFWTLLVEVWGHFTGGITEDDFAASDARLRESQILFVATGHDHDGADGLGLSTSSVKKRNFNLNDCRVAWGHYWAEQINGEDVYALVGGHGYFTVGTTITGDIVIGQGSVLIDYDPSATTAPGGAACVLDLRSLTLYGSVGGNLSGSWMLVGAVAVPSHLSATTVPGNWCHRIDFVSDVMAPYFVGYVYNWATTGSSVPFDYLAIIKML